MSCPASQKAETGSLGPFFLSTQEATGGSWLWTAPDVGVTSHSCKSSRIDLLQETQSPQHPSVA